MSVNGKFNSKELASKLAQELAEQGLIPENHVEEFAEGLESETLRETLRFRSDLAGSAARAAFTGRLMSQCLVAA